MDTAREAWLREQIDALPPLPRTSADALRAICDEIDARPMPAASNSNRHDDDNGD